MTDTSPELKLLIVALKETLLRWRPTEQAQLSLLPVLDQLDGFMVGLSDIGKKPAPEPLKACAVCGEPFPPPMALSPSPSPPPPALTPALPPPTPDVKVKRKRTPRGKCGPRQCSNCTRPAVLGFSRCELHRQVHLTSYHRRKIADLEQKLRERGQS